MKKINQRKRSGRKSSVEKIYLSGDELIEILEISKSLGNYPLSSVFTSNLSLEYIYIYRCLVNYRWKIELRKAKVDGRLVYTFNTTTKSHSLNKYYLLLELEEKFVLNLIEDLNR
jgi:hypothetical protein